MDEEATRRDFEVWAARKHYGLRCIEKTNKYAFPDTQDAWLIWLETTRRADRKAREDCCEIIRAERIENECAGEYDDAYNMALTIAARAIRATIKK